MDVGTKKLQFVYHTKVNGYSFNESLKILFEFILEHFDHSLDKESIVQLYEVYQKVIVGDYDPFNLMRMFGIKKVKKQEESVVQTKQNVEIAQTEQKESTNEVAEEVINPVTPEPEEVKIPEPVKKVEESSGEDVEVEDKDSTEPILDKDTLAKAMNFMAGM